MIRKLTFLSILGVGVFLLMQLLAPVIIFEKWKERNIDKSSILISPNADSNQSVLGVSIQEINNFPAFITQSKNSTLFPYREFKISIPKIRINNLSVKVASNDFEETPAHLPGTALPGEVGNVFITGHSSLPQFSDLKKTKAWFEVVPNIKKGDEVIVTAGSQEFKYIVEGLRIVDPKEVWVINPPDQTGRYLTLMTCVPPGFNTKRLIVLSKLK